MKNHGSPSRRAARAFTLLELLVVIAIVGILAALLLPTFGRAKARAHNAVCTSQLRQLGIATRLYADENDNRLPAAEILPTAPVDPKNPLPRICDVLRPYVGNSGGTNRATVFKCPRDDMGLFTRQGSSYEWNFELNGRRMDETRSSKVRTVRVVVVNGQVVDNTEGQKVLLFPPETTPLFLDYEDFHPRPPQPAKNVVYMDGHVSPLDLLPDVPLN
jgi:prepilin-type N-terminal cleavage/methylation domain-containing protein/prepilin-type processing-associated H-X9-DG protein